VEQAYRWLLAQNMRPENIASIDHSIGGNLAVSLALTLRDKGVPLPAGILSVSPWYLLEMKNKTWESNTATDVLLTRPMEDRKIYLLAELTVLPGFLDEVKAIREETHIPTLQEPGCESLVRDRAP
jgi:acetyl esterase/lipase